MTDTPQSEAAIREAVAAVWPVHTRPSCPEFADLLIANLKRREALAKPEPSADTQGLVRTLTMRLNAPDLQGRNTRPITTVELQKVIASLSGQADAVSLLREAYPLLAYAAVSGVSGEKTASDARRLRARIDALTGGSNEADV